MIRKNHKNPPTEMEVKHVELTSSESFMFFVCTRRTSSLPTSSGTPISISLSNLPNLLNAGSMLFGRFVGSDNEINLNYIPKDIHLICRLGL
ncbi:hypothetical protein HKD37_19G053284 [Glycine soja]